jgi:hypothetical protein
MMLVINSTVLNFLKQEQFHVSLQQCIQIINTRQSGKTDLSPPTTQTAHVPVVAASSS